MSVSEPSLRNWIRQAEVDAGRAAGLRSDQKVELRELRRRGADVEGQQDSPLVAR
jgi:transposase